MFFATENLTTKSVSPCEPWTFVPPQQISKQIRHDKQSRQEWYQDLSTRWSFYTPLEAANPNQRVSKTDNPPKFLHGFAADYDVKIPMSRVLEVVAAMDIKPSWVETSLGGKIRLVWIFPKPLRVDGTDFCIFLLEKALKWLRLDLLPGLDEGAFTDPTRLLCNGGEWLATGHGPVAEVPLQVFYIGVARDFQFVSTDLAEVPLDVVEEKLREKYPNFSWPGEFAYETQGPSFWIPESKSAMSAIVKKDGMFTFSDHADKSFYSWGDICGVDFLKGHADNAIANATKDIYWDQKNFWRKKSGFYALMGMTELLNFFKVQCRLSAKPGKSGQSPVDQALYHIYTSNCIIGAGPFVFKPSGLMEYMGRPVLNTYIPRALVPAMGPQKWGPHGNFPFLSLHFDVLFDPIYQKEFFLAWWKHFYTSAYTLTPMPGPNVYLVGGTDVGKTMTSRAIISLSVGGFVDASGHLIGGEAFNSHIYEKPLWVIDDEVVGDNSSAQTRFHAIWKKTAANQQFLFSKKYEVPLTIDWMGRIFCTLNMDYISSRIMGPMDGSVIDKTCAFRCPAVSKIIFPSRYELEKIIARELPYLLRWLLDWEPPDHVLRDVRYGYKSYQESSLLDKAHQGGKSAPFKELLIEVLQNFFSQEKTATEWRGTVTQLLRMLQTNPHNESILRLLRLEQTNRYLEMIQREALVECKVETGPMKTRVWVFARFGDAPTAVTPDLSNSMNNPFTK